MPQQPVYPGGGGGPKDRRAPRWVPPSTTTVDYTRRSASCRHPAHPGEILASEFLEPLGMTQVELAGRINVPFQLFTRPVRQRSLQ